MKRFLHTAMPCAIGGLCMVSAVGNLVWPLSIAVALVFAWFNYEGFGIYDNHRGG